MQPDRPLPLAAASASEAARLDSSPRLWISDRDPFDRSDGREARSGVDALLIASTAESRCLLRQAWAARHCSGRSADGTPLSPLLLVMTSPSTAQACLRDHAPPCTARGHDLSYNTSTLPLRAPSAGPTSPPDSFLLKLGGCFGRSGRPARLCETSLLYYTNVSRSRAGHLGARMRRMLMIARHFSKDRHHHDHAQLLQSHNDRAE